MLLQVGGDDDRDTYLAHLRNSERFMQLSVSKKPDTRRINEAL